MMMKPVLQNNFKVSVCLVAFFFIAASAFSSGKAGTKKTAQSNPQVVQWTIGGVTRQALVYIPATAKTKPTPVIFAFHGHGGTMRNMYNTHGFDKLWPEAIFICPQGLNTPGQLLDSEGLAAGWQMGKQDSTNKDLNFFDAMLKSLKADYMVDHKRIYVTGHSNGGSFTYLLWATRGDVFAAVATTAAIAGKLMPLLKPKPALHLMGETDPLVKPAWQKLTCNFIMKLNKCQPNGEKLNEFATLYKSDTGNPFIMYVHPGGHVYPQEANAVIVDFFKGQVKP